MDAKVEDLDDSGLFKKMQKNAKYYMSPMMTSRDNKRIMQRI